MTGHRIRGTAAAIVFVATLGAWQAAQAQPVSQLEQAARNGNVAAATYLGSLYENGQGVPRDDAMAAHWFAFAARRGDPVAQNNLAMMYQTGQGVPQDTRRAIELYRQAAGQGNETARQNLSALEAYLRSQPRPPQNP